MSANIRKHCFPFIKLPTKTVIESLQLVLIITSERINIMPKISPNVYKTSKVCLYDYKISPYQLRLIKVGNLCKIDLFVNQMTNMLSCSFQFCTESSYVHIQQLLYKNVRK